MKKDLHGMLLKTEMAFNYNKYVQGNKGLHGSSFIKYS